MTNLIKATMPTRFHNSLRFATLAIAGSLLLGCNSKPTRVPAPVKPAATAFAYPPRPSVPPSLFKLVHHDASSITLVTSETATDDQITAILFQLHDAAHAHTFDALHIPQKLVDARDPYMWFHIYRGPKCAAEKYAAGAPPCGGSYHAAGDYTLGSFANPNRDDAILFTGPDRTEIHLWNPDKP
jgi:hypothetical protein